MERISKALKLEPEKVLELLPRTREEWKYYGAADSDYSGFEGYFQTDSEVNRFAEIVEMQLKDTVHGRDGEVLE